MKKRSMNIAFLICFFWISFGFPLSYAEPVCIENGANCVDRAPITPPPISITGSDNPSLQGGSIPTGDSQVNQTMLQVGGGDNSATNDTNVTFKDNFLRNIQVYIMGLLGIVTVSVFLYIGYMLFTAQGKEEDFKNAWKALTYAVVGLAVIPLAFIAVKIVTGFTF